MERQLLIVEWLCGKVSISGKQFCPIVSIDRKGMIEQEQVAGILGGRGWKVWIYVELNCNAGQSVRS